MSSMLRPGAVRRIEASRSASGKGRGLSRIPLMTPKMAVLAPMPRASVKRVTAVKPGFLSRRRMMKRTSWIRSKALKVPRASIFI